jgi:riboflavin kinase / FMN adenylyltransferase
MFGERMALVPFRIGEPMPAKVRGGIVAVGNFDGVHRGHSALIDVAHSLAGNRGAVIPVTFDPHPLVLLAPERYQPPLTTIAERSRLLLALGADQVVVLQTTRELLALSPEAFFESVIREGLAASGMVEGFNFRFGRERAGSNETLQALCSAAGMAFREVPPFELDGRPVSSSRVREAIHSGDLSTASALLGRPYRIVGQVGVGAKRGGTIGFPTANLERIETILPPLGVYAVTVALDKRSYAGAANIGPNPTFGEQAVKIEVHLIDFDGDLYGREIGVDFVAKIRETKKFANVEGLIEQLKSDVVAAKNWSRRTRL